MNSASLREVPHFPPRQPTPSFPYRVIEKIGEGGMGTVFKAEEPQLDRLVAIKVINSTLIPQLDAQSLTEVYGRFIQEARALARLNHAGVVTVYRVGSEGGFPYMAMEWIDALSLERQLKLRTQLEARAALRIGFQILSAIHVAHGAVHRDIKPANMIGADGRMKLVDFGIAQVRGKMNRMASGVETLDPSLTRPGMLLGTPLYAAPEQLTGAPVDLRADLYAVGCVLYEMLTGRPPFLFESLVGLIMAHHQDRPVELSELVPELPRAVSDAIMQALALDPDDRHASAIAMARALRSALEHERRDSLRSSDGYPRQERASVVLPEVPLVRVAEHTPLSMIARSASGWAGRHIGAIGREALLRELAERPLHAEAFCGAVHASGRWLLVCDGLIFAAFDPKDGWTGDRVIEALPETLDTTLYALPPTLSPSVIPLLASSLTAPAAPVRSFSPGVVDLVALQERLQRERFDGVLRLRAEAGLGLVLFRQGKRVFDLLGGDLGSADSGVRWETWIGGAPCAASIEPRQHRFPAGTFRQQLREARLQVVRPEVNGRDAVRQDRVAELAAIDLVPAAATSESLNRGATTMGHLIHSDPAYVSARYVVAQLAPQMEHHRRTKPWRRMLDPLSLVTEVVLHHVHVQMGARGIEFDAVTVDAEGQSRHLIGNSTLGSAEAVRSFVARVLAVRAHPEGAKVSGAVLIAPAFDDEALQAWMQLIKTHAGSLMRSTLSTLSHVEGVFHTDGGASVHILLVERTEDGVDRPLMPA